MKASDLLNPDNIIADLCRLVINRQKINSDYYGMVGAAIISPGGKILMETSYSKDGKWVHAERSVIQKYIKKYGDLPDGCTLVITLSPCNDKMYDRYGSSCESLLKEFGIKKVYYGYDDPSQLHTPPEFIETKNKTLRELCKAMADTFLGDHFKHDQKQENL